MYCNEDYVQAYVWFSVAGANGNDDAMESSGRIVRLLTPAQLAEAQTLVSRFFEDYQSK